MEGQIREHHRLGLGVDVRLEQLTEAARVADQPFDLRVRSPGIDPSHGLDAMLLDPAVPVAFGVEWIGVGSG